MTEHRPPPTGLLPVRRRRRERWLDQSPTWEQARPAVIQAAVVRASARPTGNWYVLGASSSLRPGRSAARYVAGRELVVWRATGGDVHAGPGACPHLGAPLCGGPVDGADLVCHWHGMRLGPAGTPAWRTHPCHDDGALLWVRLDSIGGEDPTPLPPRTHRPDPRTALTAVTCVAGRCEPRDILANRLDPWHGAWFHPYAFGALRVSESPPADLPRDTPAGTDRFLVEVEFRLGRRFAVPVTAAFTAPGPRTVVMEIISGEGAGSVVETHATPLRGPDRPARSIVTEAVVAASGRRGFALARALAPLVRPAVRRTAARLWRDDIAYAERRHLLRTRTDPL
ncbi:DUF5914 domain-containing protein [Kitasatospora sp. NPDC002965]|uniref:DUF5914 domain-containing protein n=1 Tax=Kitasatospora sp. NPDC002965 TaxID=3154775 RepID=UPI0033B619F4